MVPEPSKETISEKTSSAGATPNEFSAAAHFAKLESEDGDFLFDRARQFRRIAASYDGDCETELRNRFVWEAIAFELDTDRASADKGIALFGGSRFWPKLSLTSEDGSTVVSPSPTEFTEDALSYYEARAGETRNPIHRARYLDILWETRRDHRFARGAFTAYRDVTPTYVAKDWGSELGDAVSRCRSIALQLNDVALVQEAVDLHFRVLRDLQRRGEPRWYLEIGDSLLAFPARSKAAIDWMALSRFIEEAISHFDGQGNYLLQREFLEIAAQIYARAGREAESNTARVRIAESFERQAEARLQAGEALVAVVFLRDALQSYVNIGRFPDRQESIKRRLKAACQDAVVNMKAITIPIEVPNGPTDQVIDELSSMSLPEGLRQLSSWRDWMPRLDKAKVIARQRAQESPISMMASLQVIRGDNPSVATNSDDEKIDFQAIQDVVMTTRVVAHAVLERIIESLRKRGLSPAIVRSHLTTSNLFEPGRVELLDRGIQRYFAEDWIAALHILPIQIEGVIRDVASRLGLATTAKSRAGGLQERHLDDLLDEERLKVGLGEDLVAFIKIVLLDQRGLNLRHDVAHALLGPDGFQKWQCDILLMLLLRLSGLTMRQAK